MIFMNINGYEGMNISVKSGISHAFKTIYHNTHMVVFSLSDMHGKITVSGLILLCILITFAGCTGTQNVPATPQGTLPAVTQAPSAPAGPDLVPSPTDSIIEANKVNINVEKDYLGNVIVTFQGGSGLQQVNKIDVTLNRADGQVKTAEVGIRMDDTVTLEGTKNTDRILVYVTMKDGKRYKVVDSLVPFWARP
jgi:hypothetical protein